MKKRLLSLLIVVLMLAAVGCTATTTTPTTAPAGTTAAPTTAATTTAVPKKVVLRIGWWGSQVRHDATLAVLDRYTLKTGVTFEPEFFSMADYLTKLNTLIAAKDAFDLMQMGGNFPTYQDNIEYLNDYIKRGVIDVTDITPAFLGITTFEGNVIGLSSGTNTIGLAYDPAIFKKANVAVPTDNWTWAEYEKAAIDITKATGVMGSSQLGGEFDALTSWIQQYGGTESFFLPPKRLALNYTGDDKVAEFFNMKLRMTKAGAYPTPAQMAEIKDIQGDPLVSGKAAMTRISSNQFVAITDAAKRPLALVAPAHGHRPSGDVDHLLADVLRVQVLRLQGRKRQVDQLLGQRYRGQPDPQGRARRPDCRKSPRGPEHRHVRRAESDLPPAGCDRQGSLSRDRAELPGPGRDRGCLQTPVRAGDL
ncbi:MAG TPA: extracellular solute-binding protein [Clostridia bacterium]